MTSTEDGSAVPEAAAADLPVLARPSEGIPEVVNTAGALAAAAAALANGAGPIAVDAERAQGFRYSSKSYLFQFRRAGSGTHIIDPVAFEDASGVAQLQPLIDALSGDEWIIHAASQDLPCLVEVGLRPQRLFDTELAGRLLGLPRVALGVLIERHFGVRLLKEHSAANWSERPIPHDWVNYAALDVELLVELRDVMADELEAAGKAGWAAEEFAALAVADWSPWVDPERWRRTSGMHGVRTQAGMAVVRELWTERDAIARRLDLAPGRLVSDRAITDVAGTVKGPRGTLPDGSSLRAIEGFRRRQAKRWELNWVAALDRVRAMPSTSYPPLRPRGDGPPPPRSWQHREPAAWARWNRVRPATNELAEQLQLPPENLIVPEHLRRLAWQPPDQISPETVDAALAALGARPWQREQVDRLLADLLAPREGDQAAHAG